MSDPSCIYLDWGESLNVNDYKRKGEWVRWKKSSHSCVKPAGLLSNWIQLNGNIGCVLVPLKIAQYGFIIRLQGWRIADLNGFMSNIFRYRVIWNFDNESLDILRKNLSQEVESNEKIGYYFMKLQYSVMISNKYNFIGDSNGEKLHRLITFCKKEWCTWKKGTHWISNPKGWVQRVI